MSQSSHKQTRLLRASLSFTDNRALPPLLLKVHSNNFKRIYESCSVRPRPLAQPVGETQRHHRLTSDQLMQPLVSFTQSPNHRFSQNIFCLDTAKMKDSCHWWLTSSNKYRMVGKRGGFWRKLDFEDTLLVQSVAVLILKTGNLAFVPTFSVQVLITAINNRGKGILCGIISSKF